MADRMTLAELRTLMAARVPVKTRHPGGFVPTGTRPVDESLGGGLLPARLTELVSAEPSSGGQTIFTQLLLTTRAAQQRIVLIDGADGFAPEAVPADALRHLVWVRTRTPEQAFAVADLLVRDGNYAVVALDLRGLDERALRKISPTLWHRLHRAAGTATAAVLVQTTRPLVPAVPWRLVLPQSQPLAGQHTMREILAAGFTVEITRGHAAAEELAG